MSPGGARCILVAGKVTRTLAPRAVCGGACPELCAKFALWRSLLEARSAFGGYGGAIGEIRPRTARRAEHMEDHEVIEALAVKFAEGEITLEAFVAATAAISQATVPVAAQSIEVADLDAEAPVVRSTNTLYHAELARRLELRLGGAELPAIPHGISSFELAELLNDTISDRDDLEWILEEDVKADRAHAASLHCA